MNPPATRPESRTYPHERVTAGILAGGRATRMGGVDKGLVELRGRAMVEYVFDALRGQASQMLINANRNFDAYARYDARVVRDSHEGFLGPLAGIVSMMAAAKTEWLLTSPCDSPRVPGDLGLRLWQAVARDGADIGVAHSGDRIEPVFALLRCSLRPDLEAYLASGERKIDRWYKQHRLATADFSDCPQTFVNVNSLDERDNLAARLGGTPSR